MLKQYISKTGKSIYSLSKETGIPYSTLNDFVNGKVPVAQCKAGMVRKLARALSISMDDLYSLAEDDSNDIDTSFGIPVHISVRHKTFYVSFIYEEDPVCIELCKVSEAASYYIQEIARWRAEEYITARRMGDDSQHNNAARKEDN